MSLNQSKIEERKIHFETTAGIMGLVPNVIEKDFWVVWTLWRLFEQKDLRPFLTFKGGTSLSKVYGVIKRFSEDVDLSIEKGFFGFGDDKSPELATSRKKRSEALEGLSAACSKYIRSSLRDLLKADFFRHLQSESGVSWDINLDASDPDGQTLLFAYPTVYGGASSYIHSTIKLEFGARSEHWPVSEHVIHSYVKDQLQEKVDEPDFTIKVLNIERTFWEKATILHAYTHAPHDKRIPQRLARHYYDMYCLIHSTIKGKAAVDFELLARVVKHKIAYFASTWSQFETAKKGTLKLTPTGKLEKHLRSDYAAMRDMFFEEPPVWEKIIETIRQFETEFNES